MPYVICPHGRNRPPKVGYGGCGFGRSVGGSGGTALAGSAALPVLESVEASMRPEARLQKASGRGFDEATTPSLLSVMMWGAIK